MRHSCRGLLFEALFLFNVLWIVAGCNPENREAGNKVLKYEEAADPNPVNPEYWASVSEHLQGSFGTTDIRYEKGKPPEIKEPNYLWEAYAWRGERVSTQLVLWSSADQGTLSFEWSTLKSEDGVEFPASELKARFVRYVLTDEFAEGCGYRTNQEDFAVSLAADVIDEVAELAYKGLTTQPVWVSIDVPANQEPGLYEGSLLINAGTGECVEFRIELEVGNVVLPEPSDWSYHLDLWQNPYSVARFHQVEPWSEKHFTYLEPVLKLLAGAGQKVVTTTLIHKPWNGQTEDPFSAMIGWHKEEDGNWTFDYSIFDRWVDFAGECGIENQINCYTMIPWGNKFYYHDETKGCTDSLVASPGTKAYEDHWRPFLLDFAAHLKQKGWFEKTAIAMDERPVEDMTDALDFIERTVPGMKVHLAGGYHPEIEQKLYDMCVAFGELTPEEVVEKRQDYERITTFYTSCSHPYPNSFTFSPPAQSAWLAWYAAANNYSGFLRWAYNSWVQDPLTDSRFRSWPAGDTYLVYPEARTSIRFERMREGIQDFEKIIIIRNRLREMDTVEADENLRLLEEHLKKYTISALDSLPAGSMLREGKNVLEQISRRSL